MPDRTRDRASPTDVESLPEEDGPSIRRTFVILTFVAGCFLLPPRQWVSAIILFALSGGLFFWNMRRSAREKAAQDAKLKAATAPLASEK
jgi:hypothetical protein